MKNVLILMALIAAAQTFKSEPKQEQLKIVKCKTIFYSSYDYEVKCPKVVK